MDCISELLAGILKNFNAKVIANPVYVVRYLLRVFSMLADGFALQKKVSEQCRAQG